MSLENSKDALDNGLYLSEVGPEFKREYEDYLLDQLVFFVSVLRQEGEDSSTRAVIEHINKLLGG